MTSAPVGGRFRRADLGPGIVNGSAIIATTRRIAIPSQRWVNPLLRGMSYPDGVNTLRAVMRRLLPELGVFSRHPQVRRDARRAPLVALGRFVMVAGCAAAVGFAITQLTN